MNGLLTASFADEKRSRSWAESVYFFLILSPSISNLKLGVDTDARLQPFHTLMCRFGRCNKFIPRTKNVNLFFYELDFSDYYRSEFESSAFFPIEPETTEKRPKWCRKRILPRPSSVWSVHLSSYLRSTHSHLGQSSPDYRLVFVF